MISDVKNYARLRLKTFGWTEWSDGFNFENIPKPKLDSTFHVELGASRGISNNQDSQDCEVTFTVRLFGSPSGHIKDAIDKASARADKVIVDLLKAKNRLNQDGLKNVYFDTMSIEPLNDSNDNGLIIKIQFHALVVFSTV